MVQSINIKALTTLASVVRRPYIAAPHVFVPTVSGECSLSFCSRFKAYRPSHLGLFYVMCSTLFPSSSVFLAGSHLIIDICLHYELVELALACNFGSCSLFSRCQRFYSETKMPTISFTLKMNCTIPIPYHY